MVLAAGKRRIDQRLLGGSQRMLGGSMGRSSTNMLNGSWNGGLSAQPKKSSLGKQASLAASNSGLVTLSVSIADAQ